MNFLAHIHLSRNNSNEMIGNFLGDFVKGGQEKDYSDEIKRGIFIHRKIDSFTDSHPIFKKSCRRFPKELRRYSRIAVDIFYDHFLAKNFEYYNSCNLEEFIDYFYFHLLNKDFKKPKKLEKIFNRITDKNWFLSYRDKDYIQEVLYRMSKRIKRKNYLPECFLVFDSEYNNFKNDFVEFYPQLEKFVKEIRNRKLYNYK
jgi:acyl carrier protein phosphodiesterase